MILTNHNKMLKTHSLPELSSVTPFVAGSRLAFSQCRSAVQTTYVNVKIADPRILML